MPPIITVITTGGTQKINLDPKKSLMALLQAAGFYVPALCGGRGSCGKCRVRLVTGSLEITGADRAHFSQTELDEGYRLACAAYPKADITISLAGSGEEDFSGLTGFGPGTQDEKTAKSKKSNKGRNEEDLTSSPSATYSTSRLKFFEKVSVTVAVDIGTTTLAFALVDPGMGNVIHSLSMVNKQREFGADVISRIQRANAGDLGLLSRCIRDQISMGIESLCREASVNSKNIREVAIAGNTTMLHLLFNLSCKTLAQAPFTPVSLEMISVGYKELFDGDLNCMVTALPGISTYVGADIVAGILFSGIDKSKKNTALMDIGTNGEMALSYHGKILCTATAAGPAFEGGNILWGTGSVPGAISQVRFQNGFFEIKTIGNKSPIGICGSAVVDTVYQGLKNGFILPNGRFNHERNVEEIVLAKMPDGKDIVFCQKDVRELQLAKSAIRSGFDALLNNAGLSYDELDVLYIAGGFGFNLNLESAAGIGLIPKELVPKVSVIGNSALGGAVAYLRDRGLAERLKNIAMQAEEFNLSGDGFFSEQFIANMDFE